jgi:hypothetical protein
MRIRIRKEKRNSIAYQLAPQELTICLPETLPTGLAASLESATLKPRVDAHLNGSITRAELGEMLDAWSRKLEVKPNRLQVRSLRNKWASCSSLSNIVLNQQLKAMPKQFIEYVICHELLHLKVRRHNKLFRSLLSAYMPDWQERLTTTVESLTGSKIEIAFST